MFYDKVPSFLVTGAKFYFLEIISNATVIFLKKKYAAITPSVTHTLIYRLPPLVILPGYTAPYPLISSILILAS